VPQDIAIAGFGAYEIAGISHPTITTINPQPRLIGARVAELILSLRSETAASQVIQIDWQLQAAQTT
jgi:LacI family gluconate utilization system Gnt-I transcriptional repressor